jgi:hypothetical protein
MLLEAGRKDRRGLPSPDTLLRSSVHACTSATRGP